MIRILIDGYNLLHAMASRGLLDGADSLESKREILLSHLLLFLEGKSHQLTVVFDGATSPGSSRRDRFGRILIEFTQPPLTADDRLIELAREDSGSSFLVVSSDRAIQKAVHAAGHDSLEVASFIQKLQTSQRRPAREGEEEDGPLYPKISTQKKGSARRPSKKDRRRHQKFKKL